MLIYLGVTSQVCERVNIALGKNTILRSTQPLSGGIVENGIVDGDITTRQETLDEYGTWMVIDLEQIVHVCKVMVKPNSK